MEVAQLGEMHAASFAEDPKHLGFVLARYKFVAKMLTGFDRVIEIGCGDTTGARLVKPRVKTLVGVDATQYPASDLCIPVTIHDMVDGPVGGDAYDGAYALDVLEHVPPNKENLFLSHINQSLLPNGVFICGSPSLESQAYASELSKLHHVNCMTEYDFRVTLRRFFGNVFVLGMQDETLHCGFGPMVHYRLAICTNPKR